MIRIRQHGENRELFDIRNFLADIDSYFRPDSWLIKVEWCQGDNAQEIEKSSENEQEYSDSDFRKVYEGIFQTIDGKFQIKSSGLIVAKLAAIDSSYWEIDSINQAFISHMLEKYGKYEHKYA